MDLYRYISLTLTVLDLSILSPALGILSSMDYSL